MVWNVDGERAPVFYTLFYCIVNNNEKTLRTELKWQPDRKPCNENRASIPVRGV